MADDSSARPLGEAHLLVRVGELRDFTRCPACLEPLGSLVCSRCGLDLSDPLAHELAASSTAAADALEKRARLLERMRAAARERATASPPPAPAPASAPDAAHVPPAAIPDHAAPSPAPSGSPIPPAPATPPAPPLPPVVARPTAATHPATSAPRRGRSSVQVVLVVIGVSLLATFAVFGLVYAFINYGVIARSLIVGGVTIAAIVTASILRRRGLVVSGEGIAALGALLVLLDVWAIRENDFFGAHASDPFLYWGAALLISAVGFVLWGRAAQLRIPSIAGHALLVPAVYALGYGVTDRLLPIGDSTLAGYLAALAGIAAALLHRPLVPSDSPQRGRPGLAERLLLVIGGLLIVPGAGVLALFVGDDGPASALLPLLGIAALCAALVVTLHLVRDPSAATRVLAAIAAVFTVTAVIAASLSLAGRLESGVLALTAPLLLAAALALGGEQLAARRPALRGTALAGAITAAVVVAFGSLAALTAAAMPTFAQLALLDRPGIELGSLAEAPSPESVAGILALAGTVALASASWSLGRAFAARRAGLSFAIVAILLLAIPFARLHGVVLGLWVLLAVTALVLLGVRRPSSATARVALATGAAAAAALAYISGWTTPLAWTSTSIALVVLLLWGRALLRGGVRALVDALALVVATVLAWTLVLEYAEPLGARITGAGSVLAITGVAALALLAGALLPARTLATAERRTLFWVSTAIVLGANVPTSLVRITTTFEPAALLLLAAAAAAALLGWACWLLSRARSEAKPERIVSGLTLAPALALTLAALAALAALAEATVLDRTLALLASSSAAILIAVGALALTLTGSRAARLPADLGAVLVTGIVLIWSVATPRVDLALALLSAAVLVLVLAISRDGLVESRSVRKHLGWVALGLAALALWIRLGSTGVTAVEPYTLPFAGVLLAIALLVQWRAPRRPAGGAPRSVPYLTGAALLVALVPSALVVTAETPLRALVVGIAILALLVVGAVSGAESSLIGDRADRLVSFLVALVGLIAMFASVLASPAVAAASFFDALTIGVVAALAALHLVFAVARPAVSGLTLSWVALGSAAVGGAILVAIGTADPIEWVTLPIAVAVFASAFLQRRPAGAEPGTATAGTARPVLAAAALLLALVPSALRVELGDPARLIAVGAGILLLTVVGAAVARDSSRIGHRADRLIAYLVAIVAAVALFIGVARQLEGIHETVALGLVIALAALFVLVLERPAASGSAALAWSAFGLSALGGLGLVAAEVTDPLEWATVPLAIALLLRGALVMRRTPASRSWRQLGAGVALLLLPSLLAAYADDPLWRTIGVGVAAFAVLLVGLLARLQAPFVLGAAVLIWHLVTQFWHQLGIVYNAVPWWSWAGIAGVLLVAIAIRYEQRVNNLKTAVRSIRQLR